LRSGLDLVSVLRRRQLVQSMQRADDEELDHLLLADGN
jgi:hypothetical protein